MEKNNLTMGIIGAMICIILLGGLLMPVVSSALVVSGDVVEFDQQGSINASFELGEVDEEIVIDLVDGGLKVGNVNYTNLDGLTRWTPFIYSDYAQCVIKAQDGAVQFKTYEFENLSSVTINLVVGDRITVTPTSVTLSGSVDKAIETGNVYSIGSKSADKVTVYDMGGGRDILPLINSINDIVCVGFYTTGELDTSYSVIDGVAKAGDGYTASFNYNFQLKDGTTDIYEIETFKVVISDGSTTEEFIPYYALVPSEVKGHADSGAVYSMIEVLPIIAIVSVLIAAIYVFLGRKY